MQSMHVLCRLYAEYACLCRLYAAYACVVQAVCRVLMLCRLCAECVLCRLCAECVCCVGCLLYRLYAGTGRSVGGFRMQLTKQLIFILLMQPNYKIM